MIKHIKQGENIGVAKQVQGAVVYRGEKWTCSDYAFDKEYKS